MTNNPEKVQALANYGLTVVERVPVEIPPRSANRGYLQTKRTKFGHLLSLVGESHEAANPEPNRKSD
jgi:3,4-dihydroxy 2-butanone 4-phosphate synthase/GTP cyclohydrolase II